MHKSLDICNIIIEGVKNFSTNKDIEDIVEVVEYSGLEFSIFNEENKKVRILTIHPELYYELDEKDLERQIKVNDYLTEINGKNINDFTNDEEFEKELKKKEIRIRVNNSDDVFIFPTKKYYIYSVEQFTTFNSISNINTKDSSFDINFQLMTTLQLHSIEDYLGKKLDGLIPNTNSKNYIKSCAVKENLRYDLKTEILNFIPYTKEAPRHYFVYQPYIDCEEKNLIKCELNQKNSRLLIQRYENFNGKIIHSFELKKFPFDTQFLSVEFVFRKFQEDFKTGKFIWFNTYFSDRVFDEIDRFVTDLNIVNSNPGWNFISATDTYGNMWESLLSVKLPVTTLVFEVNRISSYYLYNFC